MKEIIAYEYVHSSYMKPKPEFRNGSIPVFTKWDGRIESVDLRVEDYYPDKLNGEIDLNPNAMISESQAILDSIDYDEVIDFVQSDQDPDDIDYVEFEGKVDKVDLSDTLMSIGCGIVSALVDVLFVGSFSLDHAMEKGDKNVNSFVIKVAHSFGFKGEDLKDAIEFLEKKFVFAADSKTSEFGGGLNHHLRDFSHHFSIFGLLFSLITQFTGMVIGTNEFGALKVEKLSETELLGKDFPQKIAFGVIRWFFHLVSDVSGSSFAHGRGTGIPGPIVSLLKVVSSLPIFRDKKIGEKEFYKWVSMLFNGTFNYVNEKGEKCRRPFDFRTEFGSLLEGNKQFIPVVANDAMVRSVFFIKRFYKEIKNKEIKSLTEFTKIEQKAIMPFNNPVINRMITVSTGVFSLVDVGDAMVRAIKKKSFSAFIMRVNFPGICRFRIAIGRELAPMMNKWREERELEKSPVLRKTWQIIIDWLIKVLFGRTVFAR